MADSIWTAEGRDELFQHGAHLTMAGQELPAIAWARGMKSDLVALQAATGIPAAGAVAQFIHESFNPGGWILSRLASDYHNLAGLKWATWLSKHGARAVSLATWEEMDGERQDLVDAFAAFPSVTNFLDAYSELLVTANRYKGTLVYAGQPLLWLHQVWASGWATDSRYLGGLGHWMAATWPSYHDTIPGAANPGGQRLAIRDAGGRLLTHGWLLDPDGPGPATARTVTFTRDLGDALGLVTTYDPTEPAVILAWPGLTTQEAESE